MTKTSIRSGFLGRTLIGIAAVALLPAIAAAQTPGQPPRKPVAHERQAQPRSAHPERAGRERSADRREIADRRADRPHGHAPAHKRNDRDGRPERRG